MCVLEKAVKIVFAEDPSARSVGICGYSAGYGFHVIRNSAEITALGGSHSQALQEIDGFPVRYTSSPGEVEAAVTVSGAIAGGVQSGSFIPEKSRHRHLVCGLQIQNPDDDHRRGLRKQGLMWVGSLGCFVKTPTGEVALLTNNHVIAGENRADIDRDEILQPGSLNRRRQDIIGNLHDFEELKQSPPGASPANGTARMNLIDAAIAVLLPTVQHSPGFHPQRNLRPLVGVSEPRIGDHVFKVGQATGYTIGEVVDVMSVVGPVRYRDGSCWFQESFVVEGFAGTSFSDQGDSGSVVVRSNGEVLGLVFAGNGFQTFACPIQPILRRFSCELA